MDRGRFIKSTVEVCWLPLTVRIVVTAWYTVSGLEVSESPSIGRASLRLRGGDSEDSRLGVFQTMKPERATCASFGNFKDFCVDA